MSNDSLVTDINLTLERSIDPPRCPAKMFGFTVMSNGEPTPVPTHHCAWETGHPEPRYGMDHAMVAIVEDE